MAIIAFAEASRYLDRKDYLIIANRIGDFLLCEIIIDGNLLRSWRIGKASVNAYLEDYTGFILGLYSLYQADFNPIWLNNIHLLIQEMVRLFYDPANLQLLF